MKSNLINRRKHSESGVALLIAIFVLMLVSVVAISLIVASGGESALAGNYRSSTSAFLAGSAGLEEARGRLLSGNGDYLNNTIANFIPTAGPLNLGQVRYIVNPAAGENAATLLATYPDTEYATEFGAAPIAGNVLTVPSVSKVVSGGTTYYGPLFKWVRITPATEKSIQTDVNGGGLDNTAPLYYDGAHLPKPSLIVPPMIGLVPNPPATAKQAYEITALAVLPNGTQKTVQYVVAAQTFNLSFPSALTLSGKNIAFAGANSNVYFDNGTDGSGNPPAVPGCVIPNPPASFPAIGVTEPQGGTTNKASIIAGLPRPDHYTGGGLATPSVSDTITLPSSLQTPDSLNTLVHDISKVATVINPPTGTASASDLPAMSANNPATIVVDGNLDLSSTVGYGLLVVTGNFKYNGNTGWKGVILVVGDGTTTFTGLGGGNQEFDGAVFVASIKDANGNLLSQMGNVGFNISGGGGNGIYYNSCWINRAQPTVTYQVLSFRELF